MVKDFDPGQPPEGAILAIRAWNIMRGIEWDALPIVVEMLGITDIELLITQLVSIREHQRKRESVNG